jgi:predicted regulator of Ras-like GTPase activity (Roadblock/LC7/MglB family)
MDAAQALAELTEISSQIESAVILDAESKPAASTFADPDRAGRVAAAARELLDAAEREGRQGLVQLQAATAEASVFVVRDGDRAIAAVTGPDPTVGLVFYDLKTTLRLAGESETKPPKASKKKAERPPEPAPEEGEDGTS